MKKESAIAESIGALMLIALLVVVAGIVIVVIVSWYPPWVVPDTSIKVYNESYTTGTNTLFIQNKGGESLKAGSYYLRVYDSNGNELTRTEGGYTEDFNPGATINFTAPLPSGVQYDTVQFVYHDPKTGKEVLLYQEGPLYPGAGSSADMVHVTIYVIGPGGRVIASSVTVPADTSLPYDNPGFVDIIKGSHLSMIFDGIGAYEIADILWLDGYNLGYEEVYTNGNSVSVPSGSERYYAGYNPSITQDRTYVIRFEESEGHTVRVYHGGGDGVVSVGGEEVPAGGSRDFTVNDGSSFSLNINGGTYSPISDLYHLDGTIADTSIEVTSSGSPVTEAIGEITYTYSIDPVTQDYSIYVNFSEEERLIKAFVNGPGELANGDRTVVVDELDVNGKYIDEPVFAKGNSYLNTIESLYYVPGIQYQTYEDAYTAALQYGTVIPVGDTSTYTINEIPDDGENYTLVAKFKIPENISRTRIFNDGALGIITGTTIIDGTKPIEPGNFFEFSTITNEQDLSIEIDGNTYTISDFRRISGLVDTAAEVFTSGTQITGALGQPTYSTTVSPVTEDASYAVSFGPAGHTVRVFHEGEGGTIMVGGVEIPAGEYRDIPVPDGDPFSLLIDGGSDYQIGDLKVLAGTISDNPYEPLSDGQQVTDAIGDTSYVYSIDPVTQDYTITVVMKPAYTIQVFRDGPGDVIINGVVMPGDQTTFTLSGSDTFSFAGNTTSTVVNAFVTNSLVGKDEVPQDGDHTVVSGYIGDPYAYSIPNPGGITVDDSATSDYTLYVQFTEQEGRVIEAFVQGAGFVRDGDGTTIYPYTSGTRVLDNEPIWAVGQGFEGGLFAPIKSVWLAPGVGYATYEEALAAAQASGWELPGAEVSAYPYTITGIPDDEEDYTLVVTFYPDDTEKIIRIFNAGQMGTITGETPLSGSFSIQSGFSYDFRALTGVDDISITINGNNYSISDFKRMLDLADTADEVFANGVQISDAVGEKTYATSDSAQTGIPIIRNASYAVSFASTSHTVRVYHEGTGGNVTVAGVEIPVGECRNITVADGGSFILDIDGEGVSYISDLKVLPGTLSDDPNEVILTGDQVTDAIGDVTYVYSIDPVTQDYTIVVVTNRLYTIISTACQGGTITPAGTIQYHAGEEPSYVIAATGKNRIWKIYVDGVPIPCDSVNRTFTYTFDPLDADHTIHAVFAIHGVRGNYWGNAYINVYNPTPGHPDMNRYVCYGSQSGPRIETTPAWNQQIHDHIEFADYKGMLDHNTNWPSTTQYGYYPIYTTIDNQWPNRATPHVGQQTNMELFYVNWTGLMFLEQPGSYTFWTRDDDGMKVFVDGTLRTSDARAWVKPDPPNWADYYPFTVNTNTIGPGWHDYTIWHYEYYVHAAAYLNYQLPGATPDKLAATYFDELYYLVDCYP